MTPPVWRVPAWETIPGLVHGFFGRRGGSSIGEWASLNVSVVVGDDSGCVDRNRSAVCEALSGIRLVTMRQVHGARVVRVESTQTEVGEADAMVTGTAGIGLGVLSADCVPALLIAPAAGIALAVHAGWRGTVAGVLAEAVAAAKREFGVAPQALRAALGPAIGGCCYEVESTIAAQFEQRWGTMSQAAWQSRGERGNLDLRLANIQVLTRVGMAAEDITQVGPCTACETGDFFSHRRERGRTGRQIGVIGWTR